MIYAAMFESGESEEFAVQTIPTLPNSSVPKSLSENQSIPTDVYTAPAQGSWMTTNELVAPPSVTEDTTKLLQKDE
jgi:hypothetical protein